MVSLVTGMDRGTDKSIAVEDRLEGVGVGEGAGAEAVAIRKLLGLSPRLWDEAVVLCSADAAARGEDVASVVEERYGEWKSGVLDTCPDELTTREFADLIGCSTDYIAQLKQRRMLTWTRRNGDGRGGFVYSRGDVVGLFALSEGWLLGGSAHTGGAGTKGPLGHLFVDWLSRKA